MRSRLILTIVLLLLLLALAALTAVVASRPASAGLDRLTHHAEVLTITGSSFRAQGRHHFLQGVPIEQPG